MDVGHRLRSMQRREGRQEVYDAPNEFLEQPWNLDLPTMAVELHGYARAFDGRQMISRYSSDPSSHDSPYSFWSWS